MHVVCTYVVCVYARQGAADHTALSVQLMCQGGEHVSLWAGKWSACNTILQGVTCIMVRLSQHSALWWGLCLAAWRSLQ
jgi:hypothetical protein